MVSAVRAIFMFILLPLTYALYDRFSDVYASMVSVVRIVSRTAIAFTSRSPQYVIDDLACCNIHASYTVDTTKNSWRSRG